MTRALLVLRTVRYLRPGQIVAQAAWRVRRRLRPIPRDVTAAGPVPRGLALPAGSPRERAFTPPSTFTFLETTRDLGPDIDWSAAGAARLWRYHLHYFDVLRQADLEATDGDRLVASWIAGRGGASADAWDPYPVATRLANWARWYARRGVSPGPDVMASVAVQARWLERRLERHLMGNHLLRNAVGLVHAGALARGPEADRRLASALAIVARQAEAQVLGDGGHEERSPMYHALVLEDLLDTIEVARAAPPGTASSLRATRDPLLERVARVAGRMAAFLDGFRHPDGEIPLFNDAAFGMASPSPALLDRAARILGPPRAAADAAGSLRVWPETGYARLAGERTVVLLDAGPAGPDHQMGHAHADALAFEMSAGGTRLIVDSGVSTYEPGPVRAHERSTRAHATVEIDGANQSEVWASHRVARRARIVDLRSGTADGMPFVEAAHDGYRRLPGSPLHRRAIRRVGPDAWRIEDRLEGSGRHRLASRLGFAPGAAITSDDGGRTWTVRSGEATVRVAAGAGFRFEPEEGTYGPRFGMRQTRPVLVLRVEADLPVRLVVDIALEGEAGARDQST